MHSVSYSFEIRLSLVSKALDITALLQTIILQESLCFEEFTDSRIDDTASSKNAESEATGTIKSIVGTVIGICAESQKFNIITMYAFRGRDGSLRILPLLNP